MGFRGSEVRILSLRPFPKPCKAKGPPRQAAKILRTLQDFQSWFDPDAMGGGDTIPDITIAAGPIPLQPRRRSGWKAHAHPELVIPALRRDPCRDFYAHLVR